MAKRIFNTCLNKEEKLYNCSLMALIAGFVLLLIGGIAFGLIPGFAFAASGFVIGTLVSARWHKGLIQRKIYVLFPHADCWIDKNCPDSSGVNEL
ncbi:MAG: hypothetical protein DGJ47_000891 [Rickettsiaceae bacterium]